MAKPDPGDDPDPGGDLFSVAVLGHLQSVKGSSLLLDMLFLAEGTGLEFHSFGGIRDRAFWGRKDMPLNLHGEYPRERIVRLLKEAGIGLVLILSVLPETFSYTLSEAMAARIPVLALDLGAVGDRVRATGCGWLLPPEAAPEDILGEIQRIRKDAKDYWKAVDRLNRLSMASSRDMAKAYERFYVEAWGDFPPNPLTSPAADV
jgi:glycosyltransferase involved in cell wall biosynthesis